MEIDTKRVKKIKNLTTLDVWKKTQKRVNDT